MVLEHFINSPFSQSPKRLTKITFTLRVSSIIDVTYLLTLNLLSYTFLTENDFLLVGIMTG
jgi:hypothetical protein